VSEAKRLAISLVESFGHPEAIEALLTEDAQWWITPTVGILGSPSVGRDQIMAAMRVIFGDIYADASAEIHAAVGDDVIGAVRFTLRAKVGERPYVNEYSVWIHSNGERIDRVWEYLDVAEATRQLGVASSSESP
jgi:ketosteroid isomerase-like protein